MPFYMISITSIVQLPMFFCDYLLSLNNEENKNKFIISIKEILKHILGLLIFSFSLYFGIQSHPFLLADNRHYTFYLWKRVLSKPTYRYILLNKYLRIN
jgi:alpha-1,2-glucosyltransferase